MKTNKWMTGALCALALALAGQAKAAPTVVTFDDVSWLEDGYGGLSGWDIGYIYADYTTGNNLFHGWTGYLNFDAGPVVLHSLDFTSWTEAGVGGFRLYREGAQVFEHRDSVYLPDPVPLSVSYLGAVDRIEFFGSSDGYVFDNLTYTAAAQVPEPGQAVLFLVGASVVGLMIQRRRAS